MTVPMRKTAVSEKIEVDTNNFFKILPAKGRKNSETQLFNTSTLKDSIKVSRGKKDCLIWKLISAR